MGRYRLYSDRLKDAQKAGEADVYEYDYFPEKLRVQVRQIVSDALGENYRYFAKDWHENPAGVWAHKTLTREKGRDHFGYNAKHPQSDLLAFLQKCENPDFIDVLEVCCVAIVDHTPALGIGWKRTSPSEAIDEINFRLRDAGVGFEFQSDRLIRVDSQFLHAEAIKPALSLLNQAGFEGPEAEFIGAHDHYRSGHYKEAITEAAKAFESLMKAVCNQKGWDFPKGARASDLLKVLRTNNLWPDYLDASFDQLLGTLASGLPKVRNDDAVHGQGAVPKTVPGYIAAYALHLSAAKMVLIAKAAGLANSA
ncbi:HEPN domain-containing protein [Sphingomonas sp. HDW15A]|uniref:STM4504/CBY_0614 family protein n=1 Tax=Sphingomonas sp. HDW15A TaxID=2714942 RepID=UPI00140AF01C|nr:HEPN domain-containing protein [Sphingomonas sp. HDW15A]QIK95555.1 HEPN domain-containing protein [Sphingomonas sp. HDW15A]